VSHEQASTEWLRADHNTTGSITQAEFAVWLARHHFDPLSATEECHRQFSPKPLAVLQRDIFQVKRDPRIQKTLRDLGPLGDRFGSLPPSFTGTWRPHEFGAAHSDMVDRLGVWEKIVEQNSHKCRKKTSGFLKWVDGQLQEAQVAQQRDEGVHRGSEQEVADDLFSQVHRQRAHAMLLFRAADEDESGHVDRTEFAVCLKTLGMKVEEEVLDKVFASIDLTDDGTISITEFMDAVDKWKVKKAARVAEQDKTRRQEEEARKQKEKDAPRPLSWFPSKSSAGFSEPRSTGAGRTTRGGCSPRMRNMRIPRRFASSPAWA